MKELSFNSMMEVVIPRNFTGIVSYPSGPATVKAYYEDGILNRKDGPSIVWVMGDSIVQRFYFVHNKLCTKEYWFNSLSSEQKKEILYKLDEL